MTDLSLSHVVLESNCKIFVDKINYFVRDVTKIGYIIADCKAIFVQNPNFKVEFIKR